MATKVYFEVKMETSNSLTGNILIFVSGLFLILLSKVGWISSISSLSKTLEAIGFALAGYSPLRLAIFFGEYLTKRNTEASIERFFRSTVKVTSAKEHLPLLFAIDISGCISPSDRSVIELRKLQRLRGYCNFVRANPEFPKIVFYTGRSQGYLEFLVQSLGMISNPFDIPHIIENGAALYYAVSKRTIPLLTNEDSNLIHQAQTLISNAFPENPVEPKSYMMTINPLETENIDQLLIKVVNFANKQGLYDLVNITSTYSAVDITAKSTSKINALQKAIEYYYGKREGYDLSAVVSFGDTLSDFDILKNTGRAYCPSEKVHYEVRDYIMKKFGAGNVIPLSDVNFTVKVIEKECGLQIL